MSNELEPVSTMINSVQGTSGCDNCSPTMLQEKESIKPEGNDEEKGSDEMVITTSISEQGNNNIIACQGKSSEAETPLLTRLNRLDIVVESLEDKNVLSGSDPTPPTKNGQSATSEMEASEKRVEQRCKPMRWVLQEAETKGTIVERIAALEERVKKIEGRNICWHGGFKSDVIEEEVRCADEELSSRDLHMLDIPKENNNHQRYMDEKGIKNENMKNVMAEKEKEEIPTDEKEKNNKSESKRNKRSLRHMFVQCIFPHSH